MGVIKHFCLLGLLGSFTAAVAALDIPIVNPSFEAPYDETLSNLPAQFNGVVPPSAFPVGQPPIGWELIAPISAPANVGILHPATGSECPTDQYFPSGAPDGETMLLMFHGDPNGGPEYGVRQLLDATASASTTYTLNVQIGNIGSGTSCVQPFQGFGPFFIDGFPGYRVQLLIGGVVVAEDTNTVSPGEGEFLPTSLTYTTGPTAPPGNLEIRLITRNEGTAVPMQNGIEVDFDAVSLRAAGQRRVPVPGLAILGLMLAGLGTLVGLFRPNARRSP
ncbi:MAG: hypothetical protein AAF384_15515 [Pseudomonadota bacterium]